MKHLIIDTDPGNRVPSADVDDALAIAAVLNLPDVEVLGLTTVAGNVEVAEGTAGLLELLAVIGRNDLPVYEGAARPLLADPGPTRQTLLERRESEQVRRLWAGTERPAPTPLVQAGRAAEFIANTVMARPGEVTLVALGPLTNVATALLLEPRLAQNVWEIVAMGGVFRTQGYFTPVTELNASFDPEATQIVLQSGAPLTIVSLDVTLRTCLTPADLERIRAVGTPVAEYLYTVTLPWVRYVMERRHLPGCWLHDPLALFVAVDPSLVRTERMYVAVELTSQRFRGQTVGWGESSYYGVEGGEPNANVSLDLDNDRFMALFLGALGVDR